MIVTREWLGARKDRCPVPVTFSCNHMFDFYFKESLGSKGILFARFLSILVARINVLYTCDFGRILT